MLAVAALWVCAFGVMFTLMSREVKGLRQVVRQKDARRRGFGAMESGGHPQEAGWRRGFEDESRVPSAVRQETFPAGGRKRVW